MNRQILRPAQGWVNQNTRQIGPRTCGQVRLLSTSQCLLAERDNSNPRSGRSAAAASELSSLRLSDAASTPSPNRLPTRPLSRGPGAPRVVNLQSARPSGNQGGFIPRQRVPQGNRPSFDRPNSSRPPTGFGGPNKPGFVKLPPKFGAGRRTPGARTPGARRGPREGGAGDRRSGNNDRKRRTKEKDEEGDEMRLGSTLNEVLSAAEKEDLRIRETGEAVTYNPTTSLDTLRGNGPALATDAQPFGQRELVEETIRIASVVKKPISFSHQKLRSYATDYVIKGKHDVPALPKKVDDVMGMTSLLLKQGGSYSKKDMETFQKKLGALVMRPKGKAKPAAAATA